MRILLIQPDPNAARRLTELMASQRWAVHTAENAAEGLQLARMSDYDIVLLDSDRRLDLLRGVRSAGMATPVVILSATSDPDGRVRAFAAGADDVVTRTIDPGELLARMSAIVRRARGHASSVIQIGVITVDTHRQTVDADGTALRLTNKEYALFELLAVRKGAVVSHATILDHLYGGLDEPEAEVVPVYIYRLRRKLTQAGVDDSVLQTAWGRGFTLMAAPPGARQLKAA